MPFRIDSKTFADEFNSGTTTEFISANVGDEITATINVTFQELFDADDSSDYSIIAEDYSTYPFSGKQSFLLSNLDFSAFQNSYPNFFSNGIEITTDVGGGGTFTVDSIITEFTNLRIVCNEATSITAAADPVGKIWVSEIIKDCNLNYCAGGSNNNTDLSPALEIDDNVIPNFATTASPLDATDTSTVNIIPFTYEGAYKTGSLTIRGTGTTTYSQSFELIHTFELTPISLQYSEGEYQPDDINKPSNVDLSDLFNNLQSKYVLEGVFKNQVVGGVSIPFDFRETNLVVKVFDKNYSTGGNTNYSYSNFSIVRTSDSEVSDVPLIQAKFTVSFDIENATDSPFSTGNTKVKVGIENIAQTIDNSEDYEQTFLYDNAINTLDAVATAGTATGDAASITNYTCTTNSASSVTVSFDVEFTANAITQINNGNGRNYFSIFTETQNHTLDYTNSDRVVLQVFKGAGIQDILVDPVVIDDQRFITFDKSSYADGVANTALDNYPVQLLVGATRFSIDWTDRDDLRLNTIIQSLVFVNSSTGEEFEIERSTVNVSAFNLIDSTYPQGGYTQSKGYKIPSDEIRNNIQFINDGDIGNQHFFQVLFPFFIRWEYYTRLLLNDIPSTIIDNAEDFDGVNYDLYRIDQLANWDLKYRTKFVSNEIQDFEQTFDYTLTCSDYDADVDTISSSIKSYDTTETTELLISGDKYIDSITDTLIVAQWDTGGGIGSLSDFEIELLAEPLEGGSPTKIQRISSINSLLASSWFTDTGAGDGLIAKSISTNVALGRAWISKDKLAFFDNYRMYAAIKYIQSYVNEYSMLFDGTGEKAANIGAVSDFPFIQNTGIFSISLWFKMTDYTDGTTRYFMGNSSTSLSKGFWISYVGSTDSIGCAITRGGGVTINSLSTSNYVTDNNWHHLVVKGDGTNVTFYLDNVKTVGSGTMGSFASGDSTNDLTIANFVSAGSATFYGNLDEISIFDVALSDAEVSEIYNSGSPNDVTSHSQAANLQLYVRFDDAVWDGSEYEIIDSSGNGRDGLTDNMEIVDLVLDTP